MFEKFAKGLGSFFFNSRDRHRDAFLAESVDFIDLESRMRMLEMNHQPFAFYSRDASRVQAD
ncbi:DUF3563 family protein [Paraburkholderia dipogonis]|uniref:DUF3563 family protein n=1 Tax=Paraburkholderia dipogonis TaxID=1211383 RepID=UPI0038B6CC27